jgi:hypothetical protein
MGKERSRSACPGICLEGRRKTTNTSVRLAYFGLRHEPGTSCKLYELRVLATVSTFGATRYATGDVT